MTQRPTANDPEARPLAGVHTLVVGGAGMLGRAMRSAIGHAGAHVSWSDRGEFDITSPDAVRSGLREEHRIVINCAAYTDVDGAESDEAAAFRVNALGAETLAHRCAEIGSRFVHVSTDYVFDGEHDAPYTVDHPRAPVSVYGRSKAAGEEAVEASGAEFLITRTSWLYAPWGKNFVRTIARLASERDELRVVDDQRGRPSSAEGVADSIVRLLAAGARGVFHTTDGGDCSWFGFARHIVSETGARCRVEPCTTAEFPRPAPRPRNSVLALEKTEQLIGPMQDWQAASADVIRRLEH